MVEAVADIEEAVEVAEEVVSLLLPFPPVPSLMELTRPLVNRRFHLFQLCSSRREQALVEIRFTVERLYRNCSTRSQTRSSISEHRRPLGDDEIAFHTGRLGVGGLRGWERG
jgi:hypothetical protein